MCRPEIVLQITFHSSAFVSAGRSDVRLSHSHSETRQIILFHMFLKAVGEAE